MIPSVFPHAPKRWRTLSFPGLSGVFFSLLLAVVLAGCGGSDQASAGAKGHRRAGGPGRGGRSAAPPTPVAVAPVTMGPIASYYTANATLEAEKQADILARVSGVVLSILAEEGDEVRAGQELLRIQDEEYRLRLDQADAAVATQKARFRRIETMWKQNLVSADEYDAAQSDFETAKANEGLAKLNLSYTRVTAPFAGSIARRLVDPGRTVSNGTPLFTLADFHPLLARVHVPSQEFKKLERRQPVELTLETGTAPLKGVITLVSPIIDPTTGTIKVTVEVEDYPRATRPGDFAEVRIVTERRPDALLVPKVAVLSEKGERVLYCAAPDSTAERRVVEVGFEDELHAQILDGVSEGETVIVKGQRSLKNGARIRIMEDIMAPAPERGRTGS